MRYLIMIFTLLLAGVFTGCISEEDDTTCGKDTDCPTDQICHLSSKICVDSPCNKVICGDGGVCRINAAGGTECICGMGYMHPPGDPLSCISKCEGVSCSGRGVCEMSTGNGAGWCECEAGYAPFGYECLLADTSCEPHSHFDPAQNSCVCDDGYISYMGICAQSGITVSCTDGMCEIPAGWFLMGCDDGNGMDCDAGDKPYHPIYLDRYWIDQYEVTVSQYKGCVDAGKCDESLFHRFEEGSEKRCNYGRTDAENHPMNCINWFGAKQYCEYLGKKLPTDAEWEKAARGVGGGLYPWGNQTASCTYAVLSEKLQSGFGCNTGFTAPVGSRYTGVSPYGVHDMIGNVSEWVADYYDENYYGESVSHNPPGPFVGEQRSIRGGSFYSSDPEGVMISNRSGYNPVTPHPANGFRCVKDVE